MKVSTYIIDIVNIKLQKPSFLELNPFFICHILGLFNILIAPYWN